MVHTVKLICCLMCWRWITQMAYVEFWHVWSGSYVGSAPQCGGAGIPVFCGISPSRGGCLGGPGFSSSRIWHCKVLRAQKKCVHRCSSYIFSLDFSFPFLSLFYCHPPLSYLPGRIKVKVESSKRIQWPRLS